MVPISQVLNDKYNLFNEHLKCTVGSDLGSDTIVDAMFGKVVNNLEEPN